jgi:hypothetical protein
MLVPNYQTPLYGEKFSVYCHQDFGSGKRRDVGNNEVVLADVMALIAYSMADCMLACSQYTRWSNNAGIDSTCRSVTWASNLTYSDHVTGNCWLKNSTVTYDAGMTPCDWCYSATKVS